MAKQKLPPILGMNQLSDETALVRENGMFVREAKNVAIDSSGNVSRRQGYSLLLSGTGYHSLYHSKRGWLLFAFKENFGIFHPETVTATPLATMPSADQLSYTEENGILYAMNPSWAAMFKPYDTTAYPLGVPLPNVIPQFAADTSKGSLEAGEYGVTYSIVNADGEESGLGPVSKVTLDAQGSIQGTLFTLKAGHRYRIYMTTVNGEELYQAAAFDADITSFSIMDHDEGRQPATQGLEPVPYGHIIRAFNSRLLVGSTDFVYFTEAFRPHLHDPAHGWIATAGFTYMVEPVDAGVYIADKRGVRFYRGEDPSKWTEEFVSPDPIVYRTNQVVPGSFFTGPLAEFDEVVVWLTRTGYQVGTPTGQVIPLNAQQIKLPSYVQGCAVSWIQDGRKQLISPVNSNLLADASAAVDSNIS